MSDKELYLKEVDNHWNFQVKTLETLQKKLRWLLAVYLILVVFLVNTGHPLYLIPLFILMIGITLILYAFWTKRFNTGAKLSKIKEKVDSEADNDQLRSYICKKKKEAIERNRHYLKKLKNIIKINLVLIFLLISIIFLIKAICHI